MNVDARPYFMTMDYWEDLLCKLNEMRRYRRIVGSLAGSCLSAAIPLLSSIKETACLVALDIVEVFSFSVRTMHFNKWRLWFLFHSFTWGKHVFLNNLYGVVFFMCCTVFLLFFQPSFAMIFHILIFINLVDILFVLDINELLAYAYTMPWDSYA